jgi:hypothetical protein
MLPSDQSGDVILSTNHSVAELESLLLTVPQVDLSTSNLIHAGMCSRTIFIPAGVMLTGALTNIDNICITSGDITVTTDEGTVRFTGYHVLPATKGNKRAGIAHADTYWTTVWKTDLTDITDIEDEMTCESEMLQSRKLNNNQIQHSHFDVIDELKGVN